LTHGCGNRLYVCRRVREGEVHAPNATTGLSGWAAARQDAEASAAGVAPLLRASVPPVSSEGRVSRMRRTPGQESGLDRSEAWTAERKRPEWLDRRRRLAVYLFSFEHGGMMAEIDEFFVLSEKRSLRVGTALLDTAIRAMTQEGITHVQLQLATQNSNGKRFYERHGFRLSLERETLSKAQTAT
jgi:GNAT superfamily N-acetyltransferase